MTLISPTTWQPARHGNSAMLVCSVCRERCVNSSNQLRRQGWMEARSSRGKVYRCGMCAIEAGVSA